MTHRSTRDLHIDNVAFPDDTPVTFGAETVGAPEFMIRDELRDELVRLGAIEASDDDEIAPPAETPPAETPQEAKPLSRMNKAELLALAKDEAVAVPEDATNKQLIAAIEVARRAAQ